MREPGLELGFRRWQRPVITTTLLSQNRPPNGGHYLIESALSTQPIESLFNVFANLLEKVLIIKALCDKPFPVKHKNQNLIE